MEDKKQGVLTYCQLIQMGGKCLLEIRTELIFSVEGNDDLERGGRSLEENQFQQRGKKAT